MKFIVSFYLKTHYHLTDDKNLTKLFKCQGANIKKIISKSTQNLTIY